MLEQKTLWGKTMLKLINTILVMNLLIIASSAKTIDSQEAFRVAIAWLNIDPSYQLNGKLDYSPEKSVLPILDEQGNTIIAYLLKLKPTGFIVVGADDEFKPILASSSTSHFDEINHPENHAMILLRGMNGAKQKAIRNNTIEPDYKLKVKSKWKEYLQMVDSQGQVGFINTKGIFDWDEIYGPYTSSVWSQEGNSNGYVWNYYTPNNYVCGCVATAQSQILYYYEWPLTGIGSHSYAWNSQTLTANFGETAYSWGDMLDNYNGATGTETQREAVGELTYHCGVSVDMDYGETGSSASTANVAISMQNYFRHSGTWVDSMITPTLFWNKLDENMINGRPGQLSIGGPDGGHSVVIEGLRIDNISGDKEYYLNMGWGGSSDGWYDIEHDFTAGFLWEDIRGAVLDIVPTPDLSVPATTTTSSDYTVSWNVSSALNADHYELEQTYVPVLLSNFSDDAESGTSDWEINQYWETTTTRSHGGSYSFRGYVPEICNNTMELDRVLKIDETTNISYWWSTYYFTYTGNPTATPTAYFDISKDKKNWTTLKTYAVQEQDWTQETITYADLSAYDNQMVYFRFVVEFIEGTFWSGTAYDFIGFFFDDFTINNCHISEWNSVDANISTESKAITITENGDYGYRVHANWNSQWWDYSNIETITVNHSPTISCTATSLAPVNTSPGTQNVAMMQLDFSVNTWNSELNGIKIDNRSVGGGIVSADDIEYIKIYREVTGAGFSPIEDTQVGSSTAVSGENGGSGIVTFGTAETISTSSSTYYVVYDIAVGADPSHVLGVYLADASYFDVSSPAQANSGDFPIQTSSDASLPVTLTSFSGSTNEGNVFLCWITESEIENLGFIVERSLEESGQFVEISSFKNNPDLLAQGNSATGKQYFFTDFTIEPGMTYYYRIADVGLNGTKTYHGPVSVKVEALPEKFSHLQNYPNPFNPVTNIEFHLPESAFVKLKICNSLGQELATIVSKKLDAGIYKNEWNASGFASGIYYCIIETGNFRKINKMIFLK